MIKSLHLQNFKNFRDAELTIGPFTVLIGANASGKSNIRDAMRFLNGIGRDYRLVEILGEKYVGGMRIWNGIRGGIREIAYMGSEEFGLGINMEISEHDNATTMMDYRIMVAFENSITRPVRVETERCRQTGR